MPRLTAYPAMAMAIAVRPRTAAVGLGRYHQSADDFAEEYRDEGAHFDRPLPPTSSSLAASAAGSRVSRARISSSAHPSAPAPEGAKVAAVTDGPTTMIAISNALTKRIARFVLVRELAAAPEKRKRKGTIKTAARVDQMVR
jgi:hypothetical protein